MVCTLQTHELNDKLDFYVGVFGDLYSAHPLTGTWSKLKDSGAVPAARSVRNSPHANQTGSQAARLFHSRCIVLYCECC